MQNRHVHYRISHETTSVSRRDKYHVKLSHNFQHFAQQINALGRCLQTNTAEMRYFRARVALTKKKTPPRCSLLPYCLRKARAACGKPRRSDRGEDARFLTWISLFSYASYLRRPGIPGAPMKTQRPWNCGTSKCNHSLPLRPLFPVAHGLDYYLFNIVWEEAGNYVCECVRDERARPCVLIWSPSVHRVTSAGVRCISDLDGDIYST